MCIRAYIYRPSRPFRQPGRHRRALTVGTHPRAAATVSWTPWARTRAPQRQFPVPAAAGPTFARIRIRYPPRSPQHDTAAAQKDASRWACELCTWRRAVADVRPGHGTRCCPVSPTQPDCPTTYTPSVSF
jgi:hypothetical protein